MCSVWLRCVGFLYATGSDIELFYCKSGILHQRHPRDLCRFSFFCLSKGMRSGECDESLMGEESEICDLDG